MTSKKQKLTYLKFYDHFDERDSDRGSTHIDLIIELVGWIFEETALYWRVEIVRSSLAGGSNIWSVLKSTVIEKRVL